MRHDLDLAIALLRDHDRIAQISRPPVDFYAVVQELVERGDVEDLVVDGLRGVDGELMPYMLAFLLLFSASSVGGDECACLLGDFLGLLRACFGTAGGVWTLLWVDKST